MPASIQAASIEPRQNCGELENEANLKNGDSKSEKNEENSKEEIPESENSSEISQKEWFAKTRSEKAQVFVFRQKYFIIIFLPSAHELNQFNPCGESDQLIVHLNFAKNDWAKRSKNREAKLSVKNKIWNILTRSFASRF